MDKKAVINTILKAYDARGSNIMDAGSGAGWMFQTRPFQQELNQAISAWLKNSDSQPLQGVVMSMQTMGVFTSGEADAILQKIEEAKE